MSPLLEENRGGILLLTLNRPEAMNAITPEMACRLADALAMFEADPELRVAILTGAGERAFCSGGDLGRTLPLLTGARAPEDAWDRRLMSDPEVLARSSLRQDRPAKPVIAAVNGHCLAGGFEMMLGTDLRIAATHARFGLPEVQHALVPFAGAMVRLPRQIPECLAMELLLTGDAVDARRAAEMGLINRVVAPDEVLPEAMRLARRIADNGPLALRAVKETVIGTSGLPLDEAYAMEDAASTTVLASQDAREGPCAFMEKRAPRYRGV